MRGDAVISFPFSRLPARAIRDYMLLSAANHVAERELRLHRGVIAMACTALLGALAWITVAAAEIAAQEFCYGPPPEAFLPTLYALAVVVIAQSNDFLGGKA